MELSTPLRRIILSNVDTIEFPLESAFPEDPEGTMILGEISSSDERPKTLDYITFVSNQCPSKNMIALIYWQSRMLNDLEEGMATPKGRSDPESGSYTPASSVVEATENLFLSKTPALVEDPKVASQQHIQEATELEKGRADTETSTDSVVEATKPKPKTATCLHPCGKCNQDDLLTKGRELEKAHMANYRQFDMTRSEAAEIWRGIENELVDNELFDKLAEKCGPEFAVQMEEKIAAMVELQRDDRTRPSSCLHPCALCGEQKLMDALMETQSEHMRTYQNYGLSRKDAVELLQTMTDGVASGELVDIDDVEHRFGTEYSAVVEQRIARLDDARTGYIRSMGYSVREANALSGCAQQ